MGFGDAVQLLAVVRPDEEMPENFVKRCVERMTPFQLTRDTRPANWLGRKCVSLLDILQCLSPACRHVLRRTPMFAASASAIARLETILSIENPTEIVFGNFDEKLYPLALALLESRRPYGIIAHGCEIARPPKNKMNGFIQRETLLKGASWIAANSRHTESLLRTWRIPPERIKILHPPISEEVIKESASFESAARKDDALNLITICRLVRGKGIDIVLRALEILATRGIPYCYVIGGEGPEKSSLEALVYDLGLRDRVYFEGVVEGAKKWHLLRNADVYVMPSRFIGGDSPSQESFGIAFAEAAAFGVPAVGSKSGGIPEVVIDGETGILVPEESHQDLADALTFLYRNPETRKGMGWVARERARTQFSPKVIATRFREEVIR
jgi:glycosyltransferase involved in cell wall biosynthesis